MTIFYYLSAVYSSFGAILACQNGWAFGLRDRTRGYRDSWDRVDSHRARFFGTARFLVNYF